MTWKRAAWRVGMLALFVAAGWTIYHAMKDQLGKLTWEQLTQWKPDVLPLALAAVLLISANVLHAFLWRRIARDLGSPVPNVRGTLHVYFVSGLSKYLMVMGQMAGLAVLSGRFGMATGRAMAAAMLGQLVFISSGFLLVSAVLPGARDVAPRLPVDPAIIGITLALVTITGIWILVGTDFGHRARQSIAARVGGRTGERLTNAFAMLDNATPRQAAIWTAGYVLSWLLLSSAFVVFVGAFHAVSSTAPPAQTAMYLGGVLLGSYVLSYFVPVQGSIGVREMFMGVLLAPVMPLSAAVTISVLSRLLFMTGELVPLAMIPLLPRQPQVMPAPTELVS